jgi:phytoene synthase
VTRTSPAPTLPWTANDWNALTTRLEVRVRAAAADDEACRIVVREARAVLRAYSTSFFIVTRFLPPAKRVQVEAIYAAVRYPDEIVDTFPLAADQKLTLLDAWGARYDESLEARTLKAAVAAGAPAFIALFSRVVRECAIPVEHYRAFLDAMRSDAQPRPFESLSDLVDNYVYGSAIVVGYFLAHVYGPSAPSQWERALNSARSLATALQLTNFMRDVAEDQRRGRLYLPLDILAAEGITDPDANDPRQHEAFAHVLRRMARVAEGMYAAAAEDLDAFAPDSRVAIRACIDVYRQLNERIGRSPAGILHRAHVPLVEKVRVLPASKYWKLPLAYLSQ